MVHRKQYGKLRNKLNKVQSFLCRRFFTQGVWQGTSPVRTTMDINIQFYCLILNNLNWYTTLKLVSGCPDFHNYKIRYLKEPTEEVLNHKRWTQYTAQTLNPRVTVSDILQPALPPEKGRVSGFRALRTCEICHGEWTSNQGAANQRVAEMSDPHLATEIKMVTTKQCPRVRV